MPYTTQITETMLKTAHKRSFRNQEAMAQSTLAGCFYCCEVYPPSAITEWVPERDGGRTAICPRCKIDSVLGSTCGYELSPEFLSAMYEHWFGD